MREKLTNSSEHDEDLSYHWQSNSHNRHFSNNSVMKQIYDSPRQAILVSISLSELETKSKFVHRHG